MKIILACFLLFSAAIMVIIPLACGNQNNIPTGIGGAATPTPTITNTPGGPTSTWTPTAVGANTATITPTFAINTPTFEHNFGTSGGVNGMVITGANMTLAEYQTSPPVGVVESFTVGNNGVANAVFPGVGNAVLQGFPVPNVAPTPPWNPLPVWAPVTTLLNGPQGFVNPGGNGGYSAILDVQPGGGAILYYGNAGTAGWSIYGLGYIYQPYNVDGYNFVATFSSSDSFLNPKGMTADVPGNIYIADTGQGRVEQYTGTAPLHYWTGNAGNLFATNGFTSVAFKTPYAVACDTANPANVWVGDNGYTPAVVQEFSPGGTTITGGFQTVAGCVVHGITVNPTTGNIYVADAGNNAVEIYSAGPAPPLGTLLAVLNDPNSVYEGGQRFAPSCIAFDTIGAPNGPNLWVADTNNDLIMSFK